MPTLRYVPPKDVGFQCQNIEPYIWIGETAKGWRGRDCYAVEHKAEPCENPVTGEKTKCADTVRLSLSEYKAERVKKSKPMCRLVARLPETKKVVEDTKREKREHGFVVCEGEKPAAGRYCSGTACSILLQNCGGKGVKGALHSHPNAERYESGYHTIFSVNDLLSAQQENRDFTCITYPDVPPNDDKWKLRCLDMKKDRKTVTDLKLKIEAYSKEPHIADLERLKEDFNKARKKRTLCELDVG